MNRSIRDFEQEIVNQILISEICLDICKSIPIIPGRGSDFLPFYYNLNFSMSIISLHSLLLSNLSNELSIRNYLKKYKKEFSNDDITDFTEEINSISNLLRETLPMSLRNKICAHRDKEFKHTDFTNAYIIPKSIAKYVLIVSKLKNVFFEFVNHSQTDYPYGKILKQSEDITKDILQNQKQYPL